MKAIRGSPETMWKDTYVLLPVHQQGPTPIWGGKGIWRDRADKRAALRRMRAKKGARVLESIHAHPQRRVSSSLSAAMETGTHRVSTLLLGYECFLDALT
jgi:hypothetical protein